MTKYILHGGYSAVAHDRGTAFFGEMTSGFAEPKVLECLFARPEDEWEAAFAKDKGFVDQNFADKKIQLQLARFETFIDQIRWADIVYFRGGKTKLLLERLSEFDDLRGLLEGKTVAGSSAGAHMLTTYHYGLSSLKVEKGLALLPLKIIAHYKSDFNAPNIDWDKAYEKLKNYGEDLPVFTLAEGQFEVRIQ